MILCRFDDGGLGLVEGPVVRDVSAALGALPNYHYPLPAYDILYANLDRVMERIRAISRSSPGLQLDKLKLLSPVANPGKIIAAPVNYQKHLEEVRGDADLHQNRPSHTITIQEAGLFLKATSSLVGPGEGIALRHLHRRNDHEIELAVVIGRKANNVPADKALNYVAGYAIGLDITLRGTEDRSFRKSPDSYTVLGPWLVTADEIPNPDALYLNIKVNGEERQKSNTRFMILNVSQLIELASSFYTLYPGDIISTGTPEGVSPIVPGDTIVATIERIGSMEVKVRAADQGKAAN
jgi:2-keto-4-pentenoate hydratase/2-oxohepta-3-ene-1,7-dioic acid hydratase in catechol pathway